MHRWTASSISGFFHGLEFRRAIHRIAAAALFVAAATVSHHAVAGSRPAFGRPVVSGIQGIGYEQNLRIDRQGRIYTSVPDGAPGGLDWVWLSTDGGLTFKWVANAAPLDGKLTTTCPGGGGGDTELATDSAGNVYFNELTLANFSTSVSSDQGATFVSTCAAVSTVVDDRQWYAVDGNPQDGGALYLAYDQVLQNTPGTCSPGILNNELVMALSPVADIGASAGLAFNEPNRISDQCDEGIMGNVEVSPVTHNIFVVHDNDGLDRILVARCTPVSLLVNPSGMSCTDQVVTSFPGQVTGGNFPSLAIDNAGTLYVVWEQASCSVCGQGGTVTGDMLLYLSSSVDEGNHWSSPQQIPTPGLHQNVYAWIAAGDAGRFDIAWYGTPAQPPGNVGGPDATQGDWSLYMVQSLDGGRSFTLPILASEHFIHRGTVQTVIANSSLNPLAVKGDRTLGDFLQLRVGLRGEAVIAYADSNNIDEAFMDSQAMVVTQVSGTSLLANPSQRNLTGPAPAVNDSCGPAGNATLNAAGLIGPNNPNLDLLASSISQPNLFHYRVTLTVADLRNLAPAPAAGGTDLVWSTQWHVPSRVGATGGHIFHAYMESNNGAAPTFWVGENADLAVINGGNGSTTYPGTTQVTGSYTATAPGTITIDVPLAAVADPAPLSSTLYSVTSATMSLPAPANSNPPFAGIGGVLFNLIDVLPPYDFIPGGSATPCT